MNSDTQTPESSTETVEISPETKIMRRYIELGKIARDANLERDAIKDSEIIPYMESGVLFDDGTDLLKFEFRTTVKFDHVRARADGKIPDDVWKEYTSVDVSRAVMVRSRKDDQTAQAEQQLINEFAAVASIRRGKAKFVTGDLVESMLGLDHEDDDVLIRLILDGHIYTFLTEADKL